MEQRASVSGVLLIATKLGGGAGQMRPPGPIRDEAGAGNTGPLFPTENRAKSA